MPFGVHCFPDKYRLGEFRGAKRRSPLPFGVHCFPDPTIAQVVGKLLRFVSIAFRRSLLSRPIKMLDISLRFLSLHCLSAFTAFPTGIIRLFKDHLTTQVSIAFRRSLLSRHQLSLIPPTMEEAKSPLPFGVHCFPDPHQDKREKVAQLRSPLPFGVHCFPDTVAAAGAQAAGIQVSIAFRRSLLSRPGTTRGEDV